MFKKRLNISKNKLHRKAFLNIFCSFSHADQPVGFGVSTKGTTQTRSADPHVIIVLHQADVGEYLRSEEHLV